MKKSFLTAIVVLFQSLSFAGNDIANPQEAKLLCSAVANLMEIEAPDLALDQDTCVNSTFESFMVSSDTHLVHGNLEFSIPLTGAPEVPMPEIKSFILACHLIYQGTPEAKNIVTEVRCK